MAENRPQRKKIDYEFMSVLDSAVSVPKYGPEQA